jgi:D-alanine-D-alanine ligase
MRVTVLSGGPSEEREVSLESGRAVADGLRKAGHTVFVADISPTDLSALDEPCDVVFPVLHGQFGESGELQELLESRSLPFVGSDSHASRLGMDKVATKRAWEAAELPTPPYVVAISQPPDSARAAGRIEAPCVVKAIASGSSIDVYICRTERQVRDACATLLPKYGQCLIEKYIAGTELTVGIFEDRALHPIRIATTREFFDYTSKYKDSSAKHHFDLALPDDVVRNVQDLALRAHQEIGARDLSRIDVMIDRENRPYLLEINTMPGFTPKSLLPEMCAHEGIPFVELVDRLVQRAQARGGATRSSTDAA